MSVNDGVSTSVAADSATITSDSKLPTSTIITINGYSISYHTSCSVPLFIGQVLAFAAGDLTVTGFATDLFDDTTCGAVTTTPPPVCAKDRSECPLCNVCAAKHDRKGKGKGKGMGKGKGKAKISSIVLEYTGGEAQVSNQQNGKASATGDAMTSADATVTCWAKAGRAQGVLSVGGTLSVPVKGAEMTCRIQNGGKVQKIALHTSCSMSLNVGDVYGALTVVSFGLQTGETAADLCPACNICTSTTPVATTTEATTTESTTAEPTTTLPAGPYNCTHMLACTPEFVTVANIGGTVAELLFKGDMNMCQRHAANINAYLQLSSADSLSCAAATDDGNKVFFVGAANALTAVLALAHADVQAGSPLTAVTASTTTVGTIADVVAPGDIFSCRRLAAVLNDVVKAFEGCNMCTQAEQTRYEDRSCNDLQGITQKDCEIPHYYSGRAERPSDPTGAGYPVDQALAKRSFVGQNTPSIIQNLQAGTEAPNNKFGWFNWEVLDASFDPPDVGYEDCETNADCYTSSEQEGITQNALGRWDEECFGRFQVPGGDKERVLPDGTTGKYPQNDAELSSAQRAQTPDQGGQAYNRVCKYTQEKLVLTCRKPLPGKTLGVQTFCGCSRQNSYVEEGLFGACTNTFEGIAGQFGGLSCDLADSVRSRRGNDHGAHKTAAVGRPSSAGATSHKV